MGFDVDEANEVLRYGIRVLRGTVGMKATRKGKLHVALILRNRLKEMGAWWQAWILEAWIHRFQRGDFSE